MTTALDRAKDDLERRKRQQAEMRRLAREKTAEQQHGLLALGGCWAMGKYGNRLPQIVTGTDRRLTYGLLGMGAAVYMGGDWGMRLGTVAGALLGSLAYDAGKTDFSTAITAPPEMLERSQGTEEWRNAG